MRPSRFIRLVATLFLILTLPSLACATAPQSSIHQFDFSNFTYPWTEPAQGVPNEWRWLNEAPDTQLKMTNGIHRFYDPAKDDFTENLAPYLSLVQVTYGDADGDGQEEAVIVLKYGTGGTATWRYVYVYKLKDGHPILLARLEAGSRAYGGLLSWVITDRALIFSFADKDKRAGDCCSKGYIRVRYRFRDGHFVEDGPREQGDIEQNAFGSDSDLDHPTPIPDAAVKALREALSQDELPDHLRASEIHLDGPSEIDLVVPVLAGGHAAVFYLLKPTSNGYQLIFDSGGDSMSVLPTRSNGYRDLQVVGITMAGAEITTVVYRFDGHKYVKAKETTEHR